MPDPMVPVTLRVPRAQLAELDRLAAETGHDRSTIGRQLWADGIRRARAVPRYFARFDETHPPGGPGARAPHKS